LCRPARQPVCRSAEGRHHARHWVGPSEVTFPASEVTHFCFRPYRGSFIGVKGLARALGNRKALRPHPRPRSRALQPARATCRILRCGSRLSANVRGPGHAGCGGWSPGSLGCPGANFPRWGEGMAVLVAVAVAVEGRPGTIRIETGRSERDDKRPSVQPKSRKGQSIRPPRRPSRTDF
jgi:hypothetical protein